MKENIDIDTIDKEWLAVDLAINEFEVEARIAEREVRALYEKNTYDDSREESRDKILQHWRTKWMRASEKEYDLRIARQDLVEELRERCPKLKEYEYRNFLASFVKSHPLKHRNNNKRRKEDYVGWWHYLIKCYKDMISDEATSREDYKARDEDLWAFRVWCSVAHRFVTGCVMEAVRIVPHSTRNKWIEQLFGERDANRFTMHYRNGVILQQPISQYFCEGRMVLLPRERYTEFEQSEYVIRFLDKSLLSKALHLEGFNKSHVSCGRDIDGATVRFPDTCQNRPGRRQLYFHFVTSILKAIEHRWMSLKEITEEFGGDNAWKTPGRYLSRSLLRAFWWTIVKKQIPLWVEEHTFDDEEDLVLLRENVVGMRLALELERSEETVLDWDKEVEYEDEYDDDEDEDEGQNQGHVGRQCRSHPST